MKSKLIYGAKSIAPARYKPRLSVWSRVQVSFPRYSQSRPQSTASAGSHIIRTDPKAVTVTWPSTQESKLSVFAFLSFAQRYSIDQYKSQYLVEVGCPVVQPSRRDSLVDSSRDHYQCTQCFHKDTKQRLVDTFKIPQDIFPENVSAEEAGLKVNWNNNNHVSFYDWDWLQLHSYSPRIDDATKQKQSEGSDLPEYILWDANIRDSAPTVQYRDIVASDDGVKVWTKEILKYGFSYVEGCPATPEATEKLLERLAFIRNTHYGGFWDFTADLASKDMAYTNLPLGAHTDTTYFSDPAGLQMFHLLSHTDGSGGASLLVDGFRAAVILKEEAPDAYRTLSEVKIPTHASGNEGISIQPYAPFPVFNHHPITGKLIQVRWNNDDRATMDNWKSEEEIERWYDAARKWHHILTRIESEYWEQLKPGKPLSKKIESSTSDYN